MMTLDALKHYGANTAEGMGRCLNNESFYLKMVGMALAEQITATREKALAP